MLSVINPSDLTRAERVAAKAAYAAGKWQPLAMIGIGVLGMALGVLNGSSRDTLLWRGIFYVLVAWMTWVHWGFSNLLERRDAEIRRLKEALRA
jgi:hypothetical protein